jgi:predicted transcriptional regulator
MGDSQYDEVDLAILIELTNRSSFREIANVVDRSLSTVKYRVDQLVDGGLVSPLPTPGMARSYQVTDTGKMLIDANFPLPLITRSKR